ncbi:unnamed protein product [Parascedosporium putredinis]|uniref:Palmitoyltransferase PFA4 n=1 Tax=Parascedosporium putredinis TaxID=1442378 RepID=A0A9P1MCV4_9PEZI|nr:unnamed protein product [Parascedosporium putredinis]CAI8002326.1 unnamed protein product [Parascedosporium putredinis]
MSGFNDAPIVKRLAVPAVCLLIIFLAYTSQYLFYTAKNLDPGPPTKKQTITFNALLACLWWTYYRACTVSPGRYDPAVIGSTGNKPTSDDRRGEDSSSDEDGESAFGPAGAPPAVRAPVGAPSATSQNRRGPITAATAADASQKWTTTAPYLLLLRFMALWESRNWPSYLGPSLGGLIHLALLGIVCFVTSFALGIMLVGTVKGWLFNTTMIEGWEIEKHERSVERRGAGWWDSDDDAGGPRRKSSSLTTLASSKFVGCHGHQKSLLWFFPFAGGPRLSRTGQGPGWEYEENGFNTRLGMWPPPDPDRHRRGAAGWPGKYVDDEGAIPMYGSPEERKEAFQRRQEADMRRWKRERADMLAELEEVDTYVVDDDVGGSGTKTAFRNADGETLDDYGVDSDDDEDIPLIRRIDDDEDVPLGELLRRRRIVELDDSES